MAGQARSSVDWTPICICLAKLYESVFHHNDRVRASAARDFFLFFVLEKEGKDDVSETMDGFNRRPESFGTLLELLFFFSQATKAAYFRLVRTCVPSSLPTQRNQ